MQTQQQNRQEAWIKVLPKGVVTIPKAFREKLGLKEGEIAKARVVGTKLIIESRETADYRLYSKEEIDEIVKEDQLPEPLASKTKKYLSKDAHASLANAIKRVQKKLGDMPYAHPELTDDELLYGR